MAAPQGGNQQDDSSSMLWGVSALFAALGGIWYFFSKNLITIYLSFKLYEVQLLNSISGHRFEGLQSLESLLAYALAHPGIVTIHDLYGMGSSVGAWLRIPIVIIMIVLAFVVYYANSTRVFKRIYNMNTLAKLERNNWPQINPVLDLDLLKVDIDVGPWAMAMTPMQFCKRYQLLQEIRPERREGMSRKDWDKVEVVLKRGEANRLFALQLGQLWRGTDRLPMHIKALFAVFAARINSDTKEAARMLTQMSATSTGKIDFSGVDQLLKKHEKSKLVQKITGSHAYMYTVMAAMLEGARDDGVQASADFLWLKPMDRRLWYTLNTVGRQTPFVEVAGIFAHWIAEKEAGRRLVMPLVEEATKALELALQEVVYHVEEEK
jgi:intracellular multiplication protein IcmP